MHTGLIASDGERRILAPRELRCKGGTFTVAETSFLIKILSLVMYTIPEVSLQLTQNEELSHT